MRSRGSQTSARSVALASMLLAFGACLGYAESVLLPPLPVPGVRLGLANLAVVVTLATLGSTYALVVSLGRVLIVSFAAGSLGGPAFAMSLAGALAAWSVMSLLARKEGIFSPVGWSVAGSAAHVIAQLLLAAWLVGSQAPLAMTPLSLLASVPTGLVIGYSARLLVSRIPQTTLAFGR